MAQVGLPDGLGGVRREATRAGAQPSLEPSPFCEGLQPQMLLNLLNRMWVDTLGEAAVMSMIACRIEPRHSRLLFANAGHPPLLHRRAERTTKLASGGAPPLGSRRSFRYHAQEVPFLPGDVLIGYTDGLTNATDPAGTRLGERQLISLCESSRPSRGAELVAAVRQAVQRHLGGEPQT